MKKRMRKWAAGVLMAVMVVGEVLTFGAIQADAAWTGTVDVYALNIRNGASRSSGIIGVLSKGTSLDIKGQSGEWYQVTTKMNGRSVSGYVCASYVKTAGSSAGGTSAGNGSGQTGTVDVSALNVRSGGSMSASIIGCISQGTKVNILSTSGDWYKVTVSINGRTVNGYVYRSYITKSSAGNSSSGNGNSTGSTASGNGATGRVNVDALNVRSSATTASRILSCIYKNTSMTINGKSGDWYSVTVISNGKTINGYVAAQYVTVTGTVPSGSTNNNSGPAGSGNNTSAVNKMGKVNTAVLNFRSGPGTGYSRVGFLYINNVVTILEETNGWYKVSVASNGRQVTGYVSADYVTVISNNGGSTGNNGGSTGNGNSSSGGQTQESFEQMIMGFPESYKAALRQLHAKHQNWIFKPVNTGLDWNTVVAAENKFGVSTIDVSSINSSTNFGLLSTDSGAYKWDTDTYTLCDGRTWYAASKDLIKYYLDPRNFLDEQYVFCFQSLAYEQSQKQSVVESILSGSFMSGNYTEKDPSTGSTYTKSYAQTFMEAGRLSGASPYFLAARSLGEVGYSGSNSVTGTYGSFKGYYNFFNIGANDGKDAVANGLRFAMINDPKYQKYSLPWNTRYKSIVGGSKYIAENYINVGQNTPYFQRFNVVNKSSLYWHQYMTSVHGATSQASLVYNSFKKYGVLDEAIVFYIPVYNNMPSSVCKKPSSGNPNPYLKSLTLNSGSVALTPSFKYDKTEYMVVVPRSVSSVTVSATSVSRFARGISGTGTYSLNAGQTRVIQVTCTAGNGATKTYKISIYRE